MATLQQTEPVQSGAPSAAFAEISDRQPRHLCNPAGQLNRSALGWSRLPLHDCQLQGPWLREKRWDAWGIGDDCWFLMVGMMNLGYASLAVVNLYDIEQRQLHTASARNLMGRRCRHSDRVDEGMTRFEHRSLFAQTITSGDGTKMMVRCPNLGGKPFEADLQIARPVEHESMNLVIPWDDRHFHFTSKQACLPTIGTARHGERTIEFSAANTTAWLDFARGIWPYDSGWNWAMCSARVGDRLIGFNLGSGWTDGTEVNENAVYLDGRVVKLTENVRFEYDGSKPFQPWRIRSVGDESVDLQFTPAKQHTERMNLLVIRGRLMQMYGHFGGHVVDADGAQVPIENHFGVVEDHRARW